jgi:hypothetical protein
MSEPKIHTKPGKPTGKEVTCPDCGHVWYSRGKGQYFKCPKCYETATGRRYGENFIKTKGLRINLQPEKPGQADPPPAVPPKPAPADPPPAPPAGIKGIFNKPLFKL